MPSTVCSAGNSSPVAFIDSGIGGLPYLEWLKERLPKETFVYLADNANFPYGLKDGEELRKILCSRVDWLCRNYNPKMVVVACNTGSVVGLACLREHFSIPFVGVVPALKPAALSSLSGRIGLMATDRTIGDEYTANLIKTFASGCEVIRYAGSDIISFIETELHDSGRERRLEVLKPAADFFISNRVDTVVLGCTHFLFMEEEIKQLLGPGIRIIDSREGVGRQAVRVLESGDLLAGDGDKKRDLFILTAEVKDGKRRDSYSYLSEKYGLCTE